MNIRLYSSFYKMFYDECVKIELYETIEPTIKTNLPGRLIPVSLYLFSILELLFVQNQ